MIECLCVGIGGFIGSICRYLIGQIPYGMENGFPIKTLLINMSGAFFISLLASCFSKGLLQNAHVELMLKVGLCGGFTTFSTFAYETSGLMSQGDHVLAFAYMILSFCLSLAAVFLAQLIA